VSEKALTIDCLGCYHQAVKTFEELELWNVQEVMEEFPPWNAPKMRAAITPMSKRPNPKQAICSAARRSNWPTRRMRQYATTRFAKPHSTFTVDDDSPYRAAWQKGFEMSGP
jgi:hypothetical protein